MPVNFATPGFWHGFRGQYHHQCQTASHTLPYALLYNVLLLRGIAGAVRVGFVLVLMPASTHIQNASDKQSLQS
jgi:hypothetical protein